MLRRRSSCDCATSGPHCQRIRREGTRHGVEVLETSSLFRRANSQRLRSQEVTECERIADARSVVHCSPSAKRPFVPPAHKMIEFELENWRRRPDLNREWRFCRAIPGPFS
jgi:hypothetical protein